MVKGVPVRAARRGGRDVTDARNMIIKASRAKIVDARDNLAKIAQKSDARQKLEKIRNLKRGNLEVKQIGARGITLTKKVNGKLVLTTKKRGVGGKEVKKIGRLTKTVTNGKISLSSKSALVKKKAAGGKKPAVNGARGNVGLVGNNGVKSVMSEAARLDEVLMNEVVDPHAMRRTVEQGRRRRETSPTRIRERTPLRTRDRSPILRLKDRSPVGNRFAPQKNGGALYSRSRSAGVGGGAPHRETGWRAREPSPLRRTGIGRLERSPGRLDTFLNRRDRERLQRSPPRRSARVFDYDDPRPVLERDHELFKRRLKEPKVASGRVENNADVRVDSSAMNGVSPLQGCKVVITNLQTSVTQEDILELFGDIGALRRAKLVTPGHAEVTFVQRKEAQRAVEVYHNRQLDGKPMKCTLVGQDAVTPAVGNAFKLPQSLMRRGSREDTRATAPDIESIHRALFMNKKNVGKKPLFTITMPKKGKDEPRNLRMSPDYL